MKVIRNQRFWELGSILGSALGLPAMIVGGSLAKEYGPGAAFTSICIGNFILWMIGLGIISMTEGKAHAIENIKNYLGKKAGIAAALVLICALLIWYALQIKGAAGALIPILEYDPWTLGIILGGIVALLSFGGINLIKRICVFGLPLLLCFVIYSLVIAKSHALFSQPLSFSFSAILTVILVWLPGVVNLPTFFRHAASKADAILGLSLIMIIHIFFQAFTILLGIDTPEKIFSLGTKGLAMGFVLLSFLCINLVNIYAASVAWESIFPRHKNAKEYVVVGLLGTLTYILLYFSFPLAFLEIIASSFIASLGVVLLIDFLMKVIVKHRPRALEKTWSSLSWLVGCLAAIFTAIQLPSHPEDSLIAGPCASILIFLCILFIEETTWSIKALMFNCKK